MTHDNTRHSWSIRDGLIIYYCPSFKDKDDNLIELEDEITDTITCMICDEQIASGRSLKFRVEKSLEKRRRSEQEVLRRGITSPAGIDPEKYKKSIKGWHEVK